jgi:hypothetical protein
MEGSIHAFVIPSRMSMRTGAMDMTLPVILAPYMRFILYNNFDVEPERMIPSLWRSMAVHRFDAWVGFSKKFPTSHQKFAGRT